MGLPFCEIACLQKGAWLLQCATAGWLQRAVAWLGAKAKRDCPVRTNAGGTASPFGETRHGMTGAKLSARTLGDTLRPIGCVQEEIRPLRCGLPMERESRLGPLGQQSAGFSEKGKAVQRADCAAEQTRFSMGGAF